MHGTFVHKASEWKKSTECSVHHVPLIFDPVVGTLLYKAGDPKPLAFSAKVERCPECYPTVEALMRFCVADFIRNLKAVSDASAPKVEKMVVLWKDGKRDEYQIT